MRPRPRHAAGHADGRSLGRASGHAAWPAAGLAALLLAACGSAPRGPAAPTASPPRPAPNVSLLPPGTPERDGPEANPPPNLHLTPDAIPRVEPIRAGGPNKPYDIAGERYVPQAADVPLVERGLASWYGRKFHGRPTSNGESYDMYAMTAAHKTMPLPSYARVRNPANGREIVVRVNDRGPFAPGRIIDLSYTAALKLGVLGGVAPVEVERLTHEAIRTGAWQRGVAGLTVAQAPQPMAGSADDPIALIAQKAAEREAAQAGPGSVALAAAPAIGSASGPAPGPAPGAPVAAEPAGATPAQADAAAAPPRRGWWLQLGAFRQREGAAELRRRVERDWDTLAPLLAVFSDRGTHRVQAGPFASREEAGAMGDRLRERLQLAPTLVERR